LFTSAIATGCGDDCRVFISVCETPGWPLQAKTAARFGGRLPGGHDKSVARRLLVQ